MNGQELFAQFLSKRDYSGSPEDEYAQLLQTIYGHIEQDIFPLLEQAEAEGKKLDVVNPFEGTNIFWDEIQPDDVIFV